MIVVENVPENAVVEVDGDKVTVAPVKGEPVRIEAPPGKHHVLVKRGQHLLLDEPVTLESGKSYSLSVRKIPAKDALLVLEKCRQTPWWRSMATRCRSLPGKASRLKIAAELGRHVVIVRRGDDVLLAESVTLQSGGEVRRSLAAQGAGGNTGAAAAGASTVALAQFRRGDCDADARIKGVRLAAASHPADQPVHWDDICPHQRRRIRDGLARPRQGGL